MEPVVVRRAGLADLIAYVWYELGYRPADSLVLVALHGSRYRCGAIARCDLLGRKARRSLLVEQVRGALAPLVASGGTAVMALVCADDALRRPEPPLVQVLLREVSKLGLELRDVAGVSATAFRSLLCDDSTCCTAQGHDLDEVLRSTTAATQVVAGRSIAGSEADLVADVRPDSAPGSDADWDADDGAEGAEGADGRTAQQRREWWCWWRDELTRRRTGDAKPDPRVKLFWWMLEDVWLRDTILLHVMGAPEAECEALLQDPEALASPIASAIGTAGLSRWDHSFMAAGRVAPSESKVLAAREVLASSARYARPGRRAPVLTMLAWLAWFE